MTVMSASATTSSTSTQLRRRRLGQTSYADFLIFAAPVERLEGGVVMNFGSAVMGPEVYLKALAMARNVAHREDGDRPVHDARVRSADLPAGAATALNTRPPNTTTAR